MKYFKRIVLVTIATVSVSMLTTAQSQQLSSSIATGGLMLNRDIITPSDMVELSQTQFNFGTARSMAMAGAFTSLGADLSSMSINPAGLGMYSSNDFAITPLMSFQRATTESVMSPTNHSPYRSAHPSGSNRKNKFSISNFGFATNIYEGKGDVISVTMGLGYNKLQDLNYNYSFYQIGNNTSIADVFSKMLDYSKNPNGTPITANNIMGDNLNWHNYDSNIWPAILGYKTGLTDYLVDENDENGYWYPDWIGLDGIDIGHNATVESIGYIGEYSLSMGMNISNKLYLGATIGIQSVYQEKTYYYDEDYIYSKPSVANPNYGDAGIPFQLMHSSLYQRSIVDGMGVNFKLGVTYRPIQNLRLAVAIHTPTYYSLNRMYEAGAESLSFSNNPDYNPGENEFPKPDKDGYIKLGIPENKRPQLNNDGEYGWNFSSPTKMLLGASYTFDHYGVLSVDYQRDWYNTIRLRDSNNDMEEVYKNTFKNTFKGSNTVRVGLEIKVLPMLALRGGFGYSGSWLQDENTIMDSPITKSTTYYSAGIGLMLSRRTYLDFAYSYQIYKQTEYNLFYVQEYNANGDVTNEFASELFSTDLSRHNAAITFGVRF